MIRQCGSIFIMRLDVPDKAELQKEFDNKCDNCVTVNALFTCLLDFMLTKVNQMIALREEDSGETGTTGEAVYPQSLSGADHPGRSQ